MCPNPQEPPDLVTITEEILSGKLHFLCSVRSADDDVSNTFSWYEVCDNWGNSFISRRIVNPRLNIVAFCLKHSHTNRKSIYKWSLTCFKSILKISHSSYFSICSDLLMKFAIFLKSSLLFHCFFHL